MKGVISKRHLILLFSNVIFIAQTFAKPPQGVKNEFIAHPQWQRHSGLSNLQSRIGSPLEDSYHSEKVVFSANWAGAVQELPSSAGTFKSVSAQWTLPIVSRPPSANGSGEWSISEWVGIQGNNTCGSAILQAGTVSYVDVNSTDTVTGAYAWYEWLPLGLASFSDFTVAAGDTVEVSVTSISEDRGRVVVKNLSTGKSTSITLRPPDRSAYLCGTIAAWILEDVTCCGGLVPFSSFTNASLLDCSATTATGARINLQNATLVDMVTNSSGKGYELLVKTTQVSSTEIDLSYV